MGFGAGFQSCSSTWATCFISLSLSFLCLEMQATVPTWQGFWGLSRRREGGLCLAQRRGVANGVAVEFTCLAHSGSTIIDIWWLRW